MVVLEERVTGGLRCTVGQPNCPMPAASYVFGQISQLLAPCCLSRSALSFVSRQSRPARDKLQQAKMLHNAAAAAGVAKLSQVDESLESRLM